MEFIDTINPTPYDITITKKKKTRRDEEEYLTGWESLESHHIKRVRKSSLDQSTGNKLKKNRLIKSIHFGTSYRLKRPQTGTKSRSKKTRVKKDGETSPKKRPNSAISRYRTKGYLIDREEISSYFEPDNPDKDKDSSMDIFEDSFSELKKKNPLSKLKKLKNSKRKKKVFSLTNCSGGNLNFQKMFKTKKSKIRGSFLVIKKKKKRDSRMRRVIQSLDFGGKKDYERRLMVKDSIRFVNDTFDKITRKAKHTPVVNFGSIEFESMKGPFRKIRPHSKNIQRERKSSFDQRKERIEKNRLNNYLVSKKSEKNSQRKSANFFSKKSFENMVRVIQRKKRSYPGRRFDFRSPKFIMSKNVQMKFKKRGFSEMGSQYGGSQEPPLTMVRKSEPFRAKDNIGSKLMKKSMKEMLKKSVKSLKIDMRSIFEKKFKKF